MTIIADALKGLKVSPREIADRSRLPISRVQEILAGQSAAISEVRAIASGLRIPLHLLARSQLSSETGAIRPLFRGTKKGETAYDLTVEKVASFVEAALEILPIRNDLPDWLASFQPTERTYAEADRLAKEFRQIVYAEHETQPAADLFEVLGSLDGCIVSKLGYSRYEGVSLIAGNYCFIFVSPRFSGRMLFTAGHELGHLIAHHNGERRALFERPSDIATFGRHSKEEAFVDAFASCLLLPDIGVGRSLHAFREHYDVSSVNLTDLELLLLARFYGVSFEVAARRCEDLGLLPAGVAHGLADMLRKDFGSPEKRADELQLPARPDVKFPAISAALAESLSEKISLGEVSIGWAADRLGFTLGEILAANTRDLQL